MPNRPSPRKVRSGTGTLDSPVAPLAPAARLMKMKPAHTSQCTGGMRSLDLSRSKNSSSLVVFLPYDLVAAVCADVVEGIDVVVEIAGDDDRRQPAWQLAGEVGTLARQPFHASDAQPAPLENGLALGGEELLGDRVLVVDRAG